jgi:hypothetical protein
VIPSLRQRFVDYASRRALRFRLAAPITPSNPVANRVMLAGSGVTVATPFCEEMWTS